ncbi:MAG: C25 family cysteine peptidase [Acidobacteriota bacterium]|jgi:hypothetical protein
MDREKWLAIKVGASTSTPATSQVIRSGFSALGAGAVNHVRGASTVIGFQVGGVWLGTLQTAGITYDAISVPNVASNVKEGEPRIPQEGAYVAIPDVAENVTVTLVDRKMIPLAGTFKLRPVPEEITESDYVGGRQRFNPKSTIYDSDDEYPGKDFDFVGVRKVGGVTVAHLVVYYAQYKPKSGALAVVESVKLRVAYDIPAGAGITKIRHPSKPISRVSILDIESACDSGGPGSAASTPRAAPLPCAMREDVSAAGIGGAPNPPVTLKCEGQRAEYLIITIDSLLEAVGPLYKAKSKAPHTAIVTTTTTIQNEFPAKTLQDAIKDFLVWASLHWDQEVPLRYVVLAADTNKIPARPIDPPPIFQDIKYLSDHNYADLGGSWAPELAVARIPTNDKDIMHKVCVNLASYLDRRRRGPDGWKDRVLLVAPQGPGFDFEACSERIKTDIGSRFQTVTLYGATAQSVIDKMNEGALIVNYLGHGDPSSWGTTPERLLQSSDVCRLQNHAYPPMVFCICCENAEIEQHQPPAMVKAFLLHDNSVAVVGASTFSITTLNELFDGYLFQAINEGQITAGDIFVFAKSQLVKNHPDLNTYQTVMMYMLFGDPSAEVI